MEGEGWGCGNWLEYVVMIFAAIVLLLASTVIVLFWTIYYRGGFAWNENTEKQFNLHPVLMIAGFITLSGFSMLLYRLARNSTRIYVKLLHTVFHALAIPCIVVGALAVWDYHNQGINRLPNFYSLHSWLGLVTMGLFVIQFVVGFFSFLILLCCESSTAVCRASLVPFHAAFGFLTFMLAVATCLTGLTQRAPAVLGSYYAELPPQAWVINGLGMTLVGSLIIMTYVLSREDFRYRGHIRVSIQSEM